MNQDEMAVADWLRDRGHAVRHLRNGEDPPDLVVDGNIAVEVTTIASYAYRTMWDFMASVCKSLGPAEGGRGYFVFVRADDRSILQGQDRRKIAAIKRDIRRHAKLALRNHYANPDAKLYGPELAVDFIPRNGRVRLPHGVELNILPTPMDESPDNFKYEIGGGFSEAIWVVPHLIETVQSAISKKTDNKLIRRRAKEYEEWWLVVTDPQHSLGLNSGDVRTIARAVHYDEPWRSVFLAYVDGGKVSRVFNLDVDSEA